MKKRNLLKSLALALSITILAPIANIVKAEENKTQSASIQTPEIIGASALTMDMNTGEVIYAKNADAKLSPASTTKLMTALLFAEHKSKTDTITFTSDAVKVTETSLNNFKKINVGDTISADDLMKAVMVFSANDAAYLMADSVAGSVPAFVDMMNAKAQELGLKNTHFVNPSGLEQDPLNPSQTETNITTAYDLAIIGREALKNDWVRETSSPKFAKTTIDLVGSPLIIESRNKFLGKNGNIGGKTGNEDKAGHCFVGFYERDGRQLITVVLNSEYGAEGINVFNDTEAIANYGYNAEKEVFKSAGEEIGTIDLEYKIFRFFGPKKTITVPIQVSEDVMYYKNELNDKNSSIFYNGDSIDAWKLAGNKEIPLTFKSLNYVEEVKGNVLLSSMDLIKANISIYLTTLIILIIIVILIVVIIRIINMKKSRRRIRRY